MNQRCLLLVACILASCVASSVLADEIDTVALQAACDSGDASACYNLGKAYDLSEKGVAEDLDKALVLYQKACDLDYAEACTTLGLRYEWCGFFNRWDKRIACDRAKAEALYQKACDLDHAVGCVFLSHLYYFGGAPDFAKAAAFMQRSAAIIQKECDLGNKDSCEGTMSLRADAMRFSQAACDSGDSDACAFLYILRDEHPATP